MFGIVKLERNPINIKFIYNPRGIALDRQGLLSFGNFFARNVETFGFNNSSSSHTSNQKNNFLVLDGGPTDDINNSTGTVEKSIINFSKAKKRFCLSLQYNDDESYLHVNKTEICKLKANKVRWSNYTNISWYNFCLGSI